MLTLVSVITSLLNEITMFIIFRILIGFWTSEIGISAYIIGQYEMFSYSNS